MIISNPDAAILAAWEQRQEAYAAYMALPDDNGSTVDGFGPGEKELWAKIDEAEEAIHAATATTTRGAIIQLSCAVFHSLTKRDDVEAFDRGDFAAIEAGEHGPENWSGNLALAALRSLVAMEAFEADTASIPEPAPADALYVLPPAPAGTSPDLLPMVADYTSAFVTDNNAEEWAASAEAIANFRPRSHADLAVKLLIVAHYLYPVMKDGEPAIDLDAFDVDAGRKLLRCVSDLLELGSGDAARC